MSWLRLLLGIGLLLSLFYWIPVDQLIQAVSRVVPLPIVLAFFLTVTGMMISSFKLKIALDVQGINFSFFTVLQSYYIGSFFNNFIPTSVGGDIVKAYELNQRKKGVLKEVTLSVFAERTSGIFTLFLIGLSFLFWQPKLYGIVGLGFLNQGRWWILLVFLISLALMGMNWWQQDGSSNASSFLKKVQNTLDLPRRFPIAVTQLILLSLLYHFLRGILLLLIVQSLGLNIKISLILFILPIIAFSSFIPISMGGIGLREGIITFCLNSFGLPLSPSLGTGLLLRGFSLINSSIGSLFYLSKSTKKVD